MMGNTPIFRDDKDIVALQAADMLAWHVHRQYRFPEEDRPIFTQITNGHLWESEVSQAALNMFILICPRFLYQS